MTESLGKKSIKDCFDSSIKNVGFPFLAVFISTEA